MLKTRPRLIGISGHIGSGKDTFARMILKLTSTAYNVEDEFGNSSRNPDGTPILEERSYWEIKKFADKLKEIAGLLIGEPREKFELESFKNSLLSEEWGTKVGSDYLEPRLVPMTVRQLLQQLGTEAIRNQLHPNAWVNALFADYRSLDPWKRANMGNVLDYSDCDWPRWIITDVRFPNEAQAIKNRNGLLIRMNNKEEGKYITHSKEGTYISTDSPVHLSETSLDNYQEFDEVIDNLSDLSSLYESAKQLVEKYKLA